MKKPCPCCGFFTIDSDDEVVVDICEVCFWQYDEVAQKYPEKNIGSNGLSLEQAKENYKLYNACKKEYADNHLVRKPLEDELPENNIM